MIFVNLPVTDLTASTRFYEAIGCTKNQDFSDGQSSMMVWTDAISFMLLAHEKFEGFSAKPIAGSGVSEVLLALSCDSREDVGTITQAAAVNGGKADIRDPQDMGFLFSRAFEDPDGHVFEAVWMDPAAIKGNG